MHKILLELGPITIHSFGFCLALGILSAFTLMVWLGKKHGYTSDFLSNFVLVLMLSAFIGARFAYVCEHWTSQFKQDPINVFKIAQGGIMFYGGLLGGWLGGTIYLLVAKRSIIDILDLTVTVLPLGHAWGRVGCFLNGCCYGRRTDCVIGVCYPKKSTVWYDQYYDNLIKATDNVSLPVLPSQLIEAAFNLAICIVLVILYRRKNRIPGMQMGLYAIMYSAVRFFTETLRSDERMQVGIFSISQAISIGIMIFGIGMIIYSLMRNKRVKE